MTATSCACVCTQECSACLGIVAPLSTWPRLANGDTAILTCIALDICPMCRSAREKLTDDDLRRILLAVRAERRDARR